MTNKARRRRDLDEHLNLILYPALAELPRWRWEAALAAARDVDFTVPEVVALLASVGLVTWVLRIEPGSAANSTLALDYLVVFILAIPFLLLTVGPVMLHRTRRGLRSEIARGRREDGGK